MKWLLRCHTENDASGSSSYDGEAAIKAIGNIDVSNQPKSITIKRCDEMDNDEENLMRIVVAATSALFDKFEMNLYALNVPDSETVSTSSRITDSSMLMSNEKAVIRSEGYATPDTLGSWNEMDAASAVVPRRGRDQINSLNCIEIDSGCDENNYLAAFEAKFDHNVESLWNDTKPDELNAMANNKNDQQMVHSSWFDYQTNAVDKQAVPSINANDRLKQFLQINQASAFANINGNDRNILATAAQPNSLNSNSTSTIGGMNLTSSIWADNPSNSEDDVSFYTNARQWEMNQSKPLGHKLNFYSMEPAANVHSNTNAMTGASNFDIGNLENASFSKWSDTEIPYGSTQPDAISPQTKQDEKIRKNLFGNSYFYNYQSSQPMSSSTSGQTMASAENTEYLFSQAQKVMKRKVTLVNHSAGSCFKEVEPLSFEAKQDLICMNEARKYQSIAVDEIENEDLLTSERSRFRPIKHSYADGYTFDISNKLDEISYKRSYSGMLYHDSDVYREYFVYDEEGNGGSRCDTESNTAVEFTLKYCIRQNDKSCQTDDFVPNQNVLTANNSFLLKTDLSRMQSFSSLSSVNTSSSRNHLLYYQNNDMNGSQCDENSMNNDCFDKMNEISPDGRCIAENRRCGNNNNNAHALWDHCATCSSDVISLPANSLLKDELSADGDEIMSDLKYLIQGISFHSDWEDVDSDSVAECDEDDDTMHYTKIGDVSRCFLTDIDQPSKYDEYFGGKHDDDFTSNHIYSNVNKLISDLLQPEKAQTLVQAISEKCQRKLLTDEKGSSTHDSFRKIIHDTKYVQATKNENMCNSSPFLNANANVNANGNGHFGSLWAYNDNSIWRKEPPAEIEDQMQPNETKTAHRLSEQWEHANLEKIWKTMATSTEQQIDGVYMTADNQTQPTTDKTIFSTSLNDECMSMDQIPLIFNNHSKPENNTLEKFMQLMKQSNVEGQCPGTGSHTQNHTEQCHKNITRYDRKRRHSANSQNCFDKLNYALTNCDAIESFKKLITKKVANYDGIDPFDTEATDKPTTTTIITCKYWTACDSFCLTSTLSFNNNNNNNNNIVGDTENIFNCYHKQMQAQSKYHPDKIMDTFNANDTLTTMNPTTFLNQVAAMVSRPLTR